MKKCVFLDRDGVLNKDKVDYVYKAEDHFIIDGVVDALKILKEKGYLLVIITNQSGIAKGLYKAEDVKMCYQLLQNACGGIIDDLYFASYHPDYDSECLTRKPKSLMFEKAIAKHGIDVTQSYMVGDKERDLVPAVKLGIQTVYIKTDGKKVVSDIAVENLLEFATNHV
jgi:D-glycero-D-manno-heptose 1,7-bisphosphate phosphatase